MAGLLAEFRAILDAAPGRMSVGELFTGTRCAQPRTRRRATSSSTSGSSNSPGRPRDWPVPSTMP